MAISDRRSPPPARDALQRLIDGVQTLLREHLALAKIELKEDLRRTGRSLLLSAAGVPPLLAGYGLLMVAVALLIALAVPSWVAFAIVAVANLAGGAALTAVFVAKARQEKLALSRTGEELRRDREWLSSLREGRSVPGAGEGIEHLQRERPQARPEALPEGKAGSTPGLGPRSGSMSPGQPVPGGTSTPNGEPMTEERRDALRH